MTYAIGRGVKIEVSKTEGAAKTVSAVTLADPGVATSAAHGLANKSVGYFRNVTGMVQLEGQAARVANQATNTFELEDIDTSDYPAFTAGQFVPITAWSTLTPATSYGSGGGEGDKLDVTVLLDDIKQEQQGLLAAQTVTINVRTETLSGEAMTIIRKAARKSGYLVFRLTLKDGNVRILRGQVSLPGESIDQGAVGSGTLTVTVKGFICEGAA